MREGQLWPKMRVRYSAEQLTLFILLRAMCIQDCILAPVAYLFSLNAVNEEPKSFSQTHDKKREIWKKWKRDLLSSQQYHVRVMGCKVILEGAGSPILIHPRGKVEILLLVEMGSSYLKETKAHFESNKRSKEYTAHQSKVIQRKGLI